MRVLVTGASGFLGRPLVGYLASQGHQVVAASRSKAGIDPSTEWRQMADLNDDVNWSPLLQNIDAIVHLAGIAHRADSDDEMMRVNTTGTASLCQAAERAGIDRFIFVSSIRAQVGAYSYEVLTETDPPKPTTPYGHSKLAAEHKIRSSNLTYTILRPVVIDGENAKGNIKTLHNIAKLPFPLPLASIDAKRSTLSSVSFSSAISHCLTSQTTFNETYIVADSPARTIGEIISEIRVEQGRNPSLLRFSPKLIQAGLTATGKGAIWDKIGRPLIADSSKLLKAGWAPKPVKHHP